MNDRVQNPFAVSALTQQTSSGAFADAVQGREVADMQALYLMAALNPRDPVKATDRIINACARPSLAEKSTYVYKRGGSEVAGPSIRLAEAIAQEWGNFESGFREVGRGVDQTGVGYSDVQAYATDLQTRSTKRISFRVRHWRDTQKGGYALKEERDIYELVANMASRRVRNCILSVIPGDVIERALDQCALTMKTNADNSPEQISKIIETFAEIGVSKQQIEKRIQRRIESIQPAQIVQLRRIYVSIKDGISSAEDWFEPVESTASARAELPPYAAEAFVANLPKWRELVESGKKSPDDILAMVSSKAPLTDEQMAAIRDLGVTDVQPKSETDDWTAEYDAAEGVQA